MGRARVHIHCTTEPPRVRPASPRTKSTPAAAALEHRKALFLDNRTNALRASTKKFVAGILGGALDTTPPFWSWKPSHDYESCSVPPAHHLPERPSTPHHLSRGGSLPTMTSLTSPTGTLPSTSSPSPTGAPPSDTSPTSADQDDAYH